VSADALSTFPSMATPSTEPDDVADSIRAQRQRQRRSADTERRGSDRADDNGVRE